MTSKIVGIFAGSGMFRHHKFEIYNHRHYDKYYEERQKNGQFLRQLKMVSTRMDMKLLTDFLMAAAWDDPNADQKLDQVLAQIEGDVLVDAVTELLRTGPHEAWAGCLELVGILAGRFPQLWDVLVEALENRTDLGTLDQLSGVTLLKSGNRLPETGRLVQVAAELVDLAELQEWTEQNVISQLLDGPDSAIPILWQIGEMPTSTQVEQIQDLKSAGDTAFVQKLTNWLSFVPGWSAEPRSGNSSGPFNSTIDENPWDLSFTGWVTDLTASGQFGAGVEISENQSTELLHRFVMGGSWTNGIRLLDYAEADGTTPDFFPVLPDGRSLCGHPTLVKKWVSTLLDQGRLHETSFGPAAWTVGYLRHELLLWSSVDQEIWEQWTETLVDKNPVNLSTMALNQDAARVCLQIGHWFQTDSVARELVTEFTVVPAEKMAERWQSAMRVWFERGFGPKMQEMIRRLQTMSYFWLALGDTDVMNQQEWHERARAAARLSIDLSDPARVVASHPFVQHAARIALRM